MNDNLCLIEVLKKLKESSKEAVENIQSFSTFKKYMHVERKVQRELKELLDKCLQSTKSQLILVCGGVGDGKSHLISYLKEKYPYIASNFQIHNDATESFEPKKTSIDTLCDVLNDFNDENLVNERCKKLILAINLGALSNFIDSDYKTVFSKLRNYVISKNILDSKVVDNSFDENSNFQFINFSDYHLYSLVPEGTRSEYMKELLKKITENSSNNVFYRAYKEKCLNSCICANKCPIKFNYEFLSDKDNKDKLIQILIEGIVKYKLIISTRAFLNFIYDSIVNIYFESVPSDEIKDKISALSFEEYISFSTPYMLFEHKELSNIFDIISNLDPINRRSEKLDEIIIKLNTIDNIYSLFDAYIEMTGYATLENILSDMSFIDSMKEKKDKLVKLFVRLYKFKPRIDSIDLNDKIYYEFVKNLYLQNKGNKSNLKILYKNIKESIYKWNGDSSNNTINLFIGRNQLKYKISQKHNIEPDVSTLKENTDFELYRFLPHLLMKFKKDDSNEGYEISIDYFLYLLLKKVCNGYRPNKKDKENFVGFMEFIDKIMLLGEQENSLLFEEKLGENITRYSLSFDKSFNEYTFTEV